MKLFHLLQLKTRYQTGKKTKKKKKKKKKKGGGERNLKLYTKNSIGRTAFLDPRPCPKEKNDLLTLLSHS